MRASQSNVRLRALVLVGSVVLAALVLPTAAAMTGQATDPAPAPWSFGVMGDTQWSVPDDPAGTNANTVADSIIDQINTEFIARGVEFVIQTGDLTHVGDDANVAARAAAAQDLYDAGIGFYPMRGNHELRGDPPNGWAVEAFRSAFPQTQGGGETYGATGFTSPVLTGSFPDDLKGLSYSFDFGVDGADARFAIIDPWPTPNKLTVFKQFEYGYPIALQQPWIDTLLDTTTRDTEHVFVFSHQNLIAENHVDTLFTGYANENLPTQNAFFASLQANGVKYTIGGHDHLHQRSIVASPDGASRLQELITASASSKFYDPKPLTAPNFKGQKVRETSVSQELFRVGFYIFTIDGDQVTVDYYADDHGGWSSDECWPDGQSPVECTIHGSRVTPDLNFVKRESWGYDADHGTQYLFGGGAPNGSGVAYRTDYTVIDETFDGTEASIVAGTYSNSARDFNARPFVQAVDTGWTKAGSTGVDKGVASDVFRLWGMSIVGADRNSDGGGMTDTFALAMSYDPGSTTSLGNGAFGIATRTSAGTWVNAVDLNVGGTKTFVMGPWAPEYGLGTYGIDPRTKTVWAVLNHDGSFAAANAIEPVPGQAE